MNAILQIKVFYNSDFGVITKDLKRDVETKNEL